MLKAFKYILPLLLLVTAFAVAGCQGDNGVSTPPDMEVSEISSQASQIEVSEEQSEEEVKIPDIPVSSVAVQWEGGDIEILSFSVKGNACEIKVPLTLNESALKNVDLSIVTEDGREYKQSSADLTKENVFNLGGEDCIFTCKRESYGLPVLEINTDGNAPIVEKNTYIHGVLTVDGEEYPMQIRGRGNASWRMFPKKAYRIKLDDGASVLGLHKNRDWVLTSNYADKTLIRNCVAHSIASTLSGLEYTPTHIPVNLYLNGEYIGVYTFGDKIEDGKGRLDLGETVYSGSKIEDMGFLIEIGWDFDEENVYNRDYFDTNHVIRLFVKEPEVPTANTAEFLYLKNYILQMESAIVWNNGWEDYIDVDAWIDWFIVNEFTFNTESSFYRSCYLWRPAGGKLKLGPVWDFDMAFGNHYGDLYKYNGWCTTESTYEYIPKDNWMDYLLKYPAFTDRLVSRWNEVKEELLKTALSSVDTYSQMLDGSQQQNFIVWDIMGQSVGMGSVDKNLYNTYEKQVQYLRDFINTRFEYMDTRLNSDEYNK